MNLKKCSDCSNRQNVLYDLTPKKINMLENLKGSLFDKELHQKWRDDINNVVKIHNENPCDRLDYECHIEREVPIQNLKEQYYSGYTLCMRLGFLGLFLLVFLFWFDFYYNKKTIKNVKNK